MSDFVSNPEDYRLPVITAETLEGARGTIYGDRAAFFDKAEQGFADRQEQLYAIIARWACKEYGDAGLDIALRATSLMHFLLSEQAASDSLRIQYPDL